MGTVTVTSTGGVGPSDRDRTLYKAYERVYGTPGRHELENAISAFQQAGGDISPLNIHQLWLLRDAFRGFICLRGSRFAEGVESWLRSNGELRFTIFDITMLMSRDTAVAEVEAEILSNAMKTFGIVQAADKKVFAPLRAELIERAKTLIRQRDDEPPNISISGAFAFLREVPLVERQSERWMNHILFLSDAVRRNTTALEAANVFTSWHILSGKLNRIMSALQKRWDIASDDPEMERLARLRKTLAVADGTDILKRTFDTVLALPVDDIRIADFPGTNFMADLGDHCLKWHDACGTYIPSQQRPHDMDVLTYARDVLGATIAGNDKLPKGINSAALTNAIAFAVASVRSAEEAQEVFVETTWQGISIRNEAAGAVQTGGTILANDVPLPGLFPSHYDQATMHVGSVGETGKSLFIAYPNQVLRNMK